MKILYLIGILVFSIATNARACDEEKVDRDCSKESEYTWNPSNKNTTERLNRFYSLEELISAEYEKGNYKTATQYINEYLELANIYKGNWNFGNAIHDSYRYLGLISYNQGDLDQAAKYLLKSSESTGSPQLNTFGPELDLANLLLQAGKTEEVKMYLIGIKKFWEMDNGIIDSWISQIDNGERPKLSRFGKHRMTMTEKIFNWLYLLWPALISFIVYFSYRKTLSIPKFIPASILLAYIVMFVGLFSSRFLLLPIIEIVPESIGLPTLYIFMAIFSFIIPGLAAFYLSKVRYLHIKISD